MSWPHLSLEHFSLPNLFGPMIFVPNLSGHNFFWTQNVIDNILQIQSLFDQNFLILIFQSDFLHSKTFWTQNLFVYKNFGRKFVWYPNFLDPKCFSYNFFRNQDFSGPKTFRNSNIFDHKISFAQSFFYI